MKHNTGNSQFAFCHEPVKFNKWSEKSLLQYCLGGTLYMPATRVIKERLLNRSMPALKSMVMCFEDAIQASDLQAAEANVLQHLDAISLALKEKRITHNEIPLIFIRVRTPEQFARFAKYLTKERAETLTGFVFPKFRMNNAGTYLAELVALNSHLKTRLYGMPILEGKEIAYSETRSGELAGLKQILAPYREYVLNIRIGGTDFSSLFGVRRSISSSIYDILPVRDALSEILNYFNRMEDGYIVSGPVWEYFLAYKEMDLSQLISEDLHRSLVIKQPILNDAIDGLLRETLLDKTNGFVGKTVIHPSHLRFVNAMQAVTLEEYNDACQILNINGGVCKSSQSNKMNEAAPHRNWAERVVFRSKAYGVIENENDYIKLFINE